MNLPKYIKNKLSRRIRYGKVISTALHNAQSECHIHKRAPLGITATIEVRYHDGSAAFMYWPQSYVETTTEEEYLTSLVIDS